MGIGLYELQTDDTDILSDDLDYMRDRASDRQKREAERDQAYKIRDGLLTQLESGDNPCLILYNALKCISYLTHDADFMTNAEKLFSEGYSELSAQSFLINDLLTASDDLREKQTKKIKTLRNSVQRQMKSIGVLESTMKSLLKTVDDLEATIEKDSSAPVSPITPIGDTVQEVLELNAPEVVAPDNLTFDQRDQDELKDVDDAPETVNNTVSEEPDLFPLSDFGHLLYYDIEVFSDDCLIVFKNIKKTIIAEYWLSDNVLTQVRGTAVNLSDLVESHTLVGYNNHNYDDHILDLILTTGRNAIIKAENDNIINGTRNYPKFDMNTIDCTLEIEGGSNFIPPALKKIEACLSRSIEESPVPFDIDRPLTDDEKRDVQFYCESDVDATIDVYKLRYKTYFEPKHSLIELLPDNSPSRRLEYYKTKTSLVPDILLQDCDAPEQWKTYHLGQKHDLYMSTCPDSVRKMWDTDNPFEESKNNVTIDEFGCTLVFGFGGLHGINNDSHEFKNVKLLDVTSMYPSIMINLNVFGSATSRYKDIVERRKKIKHSDPVMQSALKLAINATSGCLRYGKSKLYNPAVHRSICYYGQLSLYDLSKRLYNAGYTLINLNTDGVAFTGDGDAWKDIQKEWSDFWDLQLELTEYDYFYQRDVNNYVAIRETDGEPIVKVKGGDLGKYADYADPDTGKSKGMTHFKGYGNTCGIVTRCLYNYLVYRKDPKETVLENIDDPYLFQFVLNTGNVFKATVDSDGREYQKVNRVFATTGDGVTLKKLKADGTLTKFSNVPDNQFVYNGALNELDRDTFMNMIDVDYYCDLAKKTIKNWVPEAFNDHDSEPLTDDDFFDNFFSEVQEV